MRETRWEFSSDGFNWRTLAPGEPVPSGVRCRLVPIGSGPWPPTGQLDGRLVDVVAAPPVQPGQYRRYIDIAAALDSCFSPATPKRAPRWTATPRGHLMYDDLPVADLRYSAARTRIEFILAALNAAEEKR